MEVYTSVLFLSLIAAGVMAAPQAAPQENDIRLVTTQTTTTRAGRVEVFHEGRWGSVCNQGFEMEDAKVVCRQWGYPGGAYSVKYYESRYGRGEGPFMLSNVRCTGTEAKLTDCPADPWGQNNCTVNQEAGVLCRGTRTAAPQENDIRLVSTQTTTTRAGRVEVFHEGRWGSVCNQGFEMEDAKVVCRQWGYPAGAYSVKYYESRYGRGQGPFMLSNVRCTGTEAKLTDCPADPWGQNNCTVSQEAGVLCTGTRTEQTNAARELYDMIEQLEEAYAEKEEAYAEKEEDFFQTLKEEDEAYQEKKELELVAEILAQLEDN